MPTDAGVERLASELAAVLAERLAMPLIVDKHAAARLLGFKSSDSFMRECQAKRPEGFPQPLPGDGHPRFAVADLTAWVERLRGRPRRPRRRSAAAAAAGA